LIAKRISTKVLKGGLDGDELEAEKQMKFKQWVRASKVKDWTVVHVF
jgi:hypothetical protein